MSVTVKTAYLMEVGIITYSAKGIILVGGLGSRLYLYEYLKTNHGGSNIEVHQSIGIRS
jgi:hypothetical protein